MSPGGPTALSLSLLMENIQVLFRSERMHTIFLVSNRKRNDDLARAAAPRTFSQKTTLDSSLELQLGLHILFNKEDGRCGLLHRGRSGPY